MSDQALGWVSVVIGAVGLFLQIFPIHRNPRRRRRLSLRHWKFWGIEHTRLDMTDDHQL
jgi:hypothetical protein